MKPLRIDMTNDLETAGSSPDDNARARRRVLIVEDNFFVAHLCESALIEAGYDVVDVVLTAEDAVRAAVERHPELVLMDIYLPGKRDGIDAANEIFERCGIRCIFASALADTAAKARADATLPLAWLAKPFSEKKLVRTIASALEEIDALAQARA